MNRKIMIMVMVLSLTTAITACGVSTANQKPAAQTFLSAQEVTEEDNLPDAEEASAKNVNDTYYNDMDGKQIKATDSRDIDYKNASSDNTKQDKEIKSYTARGIVSDIADNMIVLRIDSDHAYMFTRDISTKITGISDRVEIDDDVIVTYTAEPGNTACAYGIEVVRKADHERYSLTGKIEKADGTFLQISAGNAMYTFTMDDNTIVSGDRLAPGNEAVVIYVNKLDQKPLAISVSCTEKDTPKKAQKAAVKKEKATPKKKAKVQKAEAEKPVQASTPVTPIQEVRQNTESAEKEQMQVEIVVDQNKEEPEKDIDQEITNAPEESTNDPEDPANNPEDPGKNPEDPGNNPEDPGNNPEDPANDPEEDPTDIPEEPTNEPTEEPPVTEEPVVTDEPVVTEQPEQEETIEQPQEEQKVEKTGTITAWNNGKSCTIQFDDGETMKLALTPDTSIAGGYSPEVNDIVTVSFNKSDGSALKIQLLERPEKEEAAPEEAEE